MIKKIFNYFEPLWTSKDKKPSIRRLLSLFFTLLFAIEVLKENTQVEVLWAIGAMIGGLLSLTTVQNLGHASIDKDKEISKDIIEKVDKVEIDTVSD